MNGFVISLMMLVVPDVCWGPPLDKTGTTGSGFGSVGSKTLVKQEPADAGSFLAEREGFEPSLPLRVNQFSRLTHSTTLPPLQSLLS